MEVTGRGRQNKAKEDNRRRRRENGGEEREVRKTGKWKKYVGLILLPAHTHIQWKRQTKVRAQVTMRRGCRHRKHAHADVRRNRSSNEKKKQQTRQGGVSGHMRGKGNKTVGFTNGEAEYGGEEKEERRGEFRCGRAGRTVTPRATEALRRCISAHIDAYWTHVRRGQRGSFAACHRQSCHVEE